MVNYANYTIGDRNVICRDVCGDIKQAVSGFEMVLACPCLPLRVFHLGAQGSS